MLQPKNDKTFLMFDLDVDGMLEHLQSIPDAGIAGVESMY